MIATLSLDVGASLQATGRQNAEGATKTWEDLARYESVLRATRPELVVECGTYRGASAVWFAGHGLDVLTIDVNPVGITHPRVTFLCGDSTAPWVVALVARFAEGRRTMVVLDSDHSGAHVAGEIKAYGPLVSPGCYLVVEDGIVRFMAGHGEGGSPLDAIEELLEPSPDWRRDEEVEAMFPVTMFPAGWWQRCSLT